MLREYLRHPTLSRIAFLSTLAVASLCLLIKAAYIFDDEPYRMTIKPFQGRGKVQFFEPGRRLVSPEFDVDFPFQTSHVVILDSPIVMIPGGASSSATDLPCPDDSRFVSAARSST